MNHEVAPRLGKAERHARIVAALRGAPQLRVAQLAHELAVSTETVRRDLDELGGLGLISRTYGGAVRALATEPAVHERHAMMVEERRRIAAHAVARIRPGDVVMIGGGATTLHIARRIAAECRDLTVITHSIAVATAIGAHPGIEVLITPGRFDASEGCLFGEETVSFLGGWNADRTFVGASGISADGPSDVLAPAAAVYRAMHRRAGETVVVADHGKFDRKALAVWSGWSGIAALVTDVAPAGSLAEALGRAAVEITIATPGQAPASRPAA